MIKLDDNTIIESSSFYFTGNINLRLPIDKSLIKALNERDVTILDYKGKDEKGRYLSELFTTHFKINHNPLNFSIGNQTTEVDLEELRRIDENLGYNRFSDLNLKEKLLISWRTFITSNGMGTIILEFHTKKPISQHIHRKLSLIYLNFPILKTEGLDYLFVTQTPEDKKIVKKPYISIENLCERYEIELIAKIRELVERNPVFQREHYHVLPNQGWNRFKSLDYETIIPIIILNVKKPKASSQLDWFNQHKKLIAYYIAKPELFEMGVLSEMYIDSITKKEKIWSIDENSMALGNYHGFVRIQFLTDDGDDYRSERVRFSGFWMDSQNAYLYTVLITIQNYFTLRIFDNYLDKKSGEIRNNKENYLEKVSFVNNLLNKMNDQVEEVENIDKLLDSDPHIKLTHLVGHAFQIDNWMGMVVKKIKSLEKYVSTVEYIESNRSRGAMERILYIIAFIGVVTGVIEALNSFGLLPWW
jgi:hypothetical protein